jgi:LPXTG-site transpeptidase (sortase) family protein
LVFVWELKRYFIRLLLILALVTFSLGLFYFIKNNNQKKVFPGQTVNNLTFGLPVKLIIPPINVSADIQYLGVNPKGEMAVPGNIVDVGWFKLGPLPGEIGSAVIAGHFNGVNNQAGVFANLDKLKPGDKLSVIDDKGVSVTFVVRESRLYDSGFADDVFSQNDSAHLNLVTCDGLWDKVKKSYTKRLVVFTDILK